MTNAPVHPLPARGRDVLLTLWIALLGADRLDLLGGATTFSLTPFLVLTPLLIVSVLVDRLRAPKLLDVPRPMMRYVVLVCALVVVAGISVFVSPDPSLSAQRTFLMAVQIVGSLAVVLLRPDVRADAGRMLPGVKLGLLVFLGFNVLQGFAFLSKVPQDIHIGPVVLHTIASEYAGLVPRFSGSAFDPNRGGILLVFYLAVLLQARESLKVRARLGMPWIFLIVVFLLGTLSRSSVIAAIILVVMTLLERTRIRVRPGSAFVGAMFVLLSAVYLMIVPRTFGILERASAPFATRFSVAEGSAQGHLALLKRGMADATSSVPTVAIGRGFGSSYVFLQDLFPGSRYGNYHSLYVSMFAESGIVALALVLLIALVPAFRAGPYRPMVAALAVFNVFYQLTTEPLFWTIMALSWSTLVIHHVSHERRTEA